MSEMWINLNIDGAPYAMKVARTVWGGGKVGDDFKDLPIAHRFSPNRSCLTVRREPHFIEDSWRRKAQIG